MGKVDREPGTHIIIRCSHIPQEQCFGCSFPSGFVNSGVCCVHDHQILGMNIMNETTDLQGSFVWLLVVMHQLIVVPSRTCSAFH